MADKKIRHGCLTAWLVLKIIGNLVTVYMYLCLIYARVFIHVFGPGAMPEMSPMPTWAFPVLIVVSLFNLVCTIALFRWKKWGFWGICATSVVALVVNLSVGLGTGKPFIGLLGVLLLYGVLHIGKENKGWPQLD